MQCEDERATRQAVRHAIGPRVYSTINDLTIRIQQLKGDRPAGTHTDLGIHGEMLVMPAKEILDREKHE
jgi:hypothetical protein